MSDYTNLVHSIKNQNEALSNTKQILKDRYSIDDKRVEYQTEEMGVIKTINNILFYFYFLLVLLMIFILVFSKRYVPIFVKFIVIACFLSYPFVILWLEGLIYESCKYLFALLTGKVYDPPTKPLSISEI